jgi:hypothetical protein
MKTILKYVKRFQTGLVIDVKRMCRRCAEEELDKSDATLETSPGKHLL